MKRAMVFLAILLVLSVTILPGPATAGGGWNHGHRGGRAGWWLPGALIGGLVVGAVTLATAPLWALTPPPAPVVVQTPPPAVYVQPPVYALRALPVPPPDSAPPPRAYQQPVTYTAAATPGVTREVVYDHGRYVLHGDGVRQPWQWVWVPAAAPPPPPPPPPR
jgi:hypothetical protein